MYTIEVQDPVTGLWGEPDTTYVQAVPTEGTRRGFEW
jgi:hypothetical protein